MKKLWILQGVIVNIEASDANGQISVDIEYDANGQRAHTGNVALDELVAVSKDLLSSNSDFFGLSG